METRTLGIILNGVTGRMAPTSTSSARSSRSSSKAASKVNDNLRLMPDPILTGRSSEKLKALAEAHGPGTIGKPLKFTTDLASTMADRNYPIFFDASGTLQRAGFIEMAVKAGKSIYCEKPTAVTTDEALRLAKLCEDAKLKNGVVQDKLWLPGMRKIRALTQQGFFGDVCRYAGNSATGSSPATLTTSPPNAPVGTTATKTAAASSSTCSATGSTSSPTSSAPSNRSSPTATSIFPSASTNPPSPTRRPPTTRRMPSSNSRTASPASSTRAGARACGVTIC